MLKSSTHEASQGLVDSLRQAFLLIVWVQTAFLQAQRAWPYTLPTMPVFKPGTSSTVQMLLRPVSGDGDTVSERRLLGALRSGALFRSYVRSLMMQSLYFPVGMRKPNRSRMWSRSRRCFMAEASV